MRLPSSASIEGCSSSSIYPCSSRVLPKLWWRSSVVELLLSLPTSLGTISAPPIFVIVRSKSDGWGPTVQREPAMIRT